MAPLIFKNDGVPEGSLLGSTLGYIYGYIMGTTGDVPD